MKKGNVTGKQVLYIIILVYSNYCSWNHFKNIKHDMKMIQKAASNISDVLSSKIDKRIYQISEKEYRL